MNSLANIVDFQTAKERLRPYKHIRLVDREWEKKEQAWIALFAELGQRVRDWGQKNGN